MSEINTLPEEKKVTQQSEVSTDSSANKASLSEKEDAAKSNAMIAYIMMAIGVFVGITWLIGAIWAMVKKSDAQDTIFYDHYTNITKTFWIGLALSLLSIPLMFVVVGYFLLLAVWIWSIYRIVKGFAKLTSNKSYNA